jgi:hypothetical protein
VVSDKARLAQFGSATGPRRKLSACVSAKALLGLATSACHPALATGWSQIASGCEVGYNDRNRTMKTPMTLLALALVSAPAQQDFSKVEIKTVHVAKNIYMLLGAGGNIGVSVGPDGILIVDDQFAPLAEKIEAALKQLNRAQHTFSR